MQMHVYVETCWSHGTETELVVKMLCQSSVTVHLESYHLQPAASRTSSTNPLMAAIKLHGDSNGSQCPMYPSADFEDTVISFTKTKKTFKHHNSDVDNSSVSQVRSQGKWERSDDPPPTALKGHFSTDCSSANVLSIIRLWNKINKINQTYHVYSSFDHKVMSPIIIIFKIKFSLRQPLKRSKIWGKRPPPPYQKVGYVPVSWTQVRHVLTVHAPVLSVNTSNNLCRVTVGIFRMWR